MMNRFVSPISIARCTCHKSRSNILQPVPSKGFSARYNHSAPRNYSKDYYAILGIKKSATLKDIKAAYYDKAKLYHPDASSSDEPQPLKFQEVAEAYEILSDDSMRKAYDALTRSPQPSSFYDPYDQRTSKPSRPPKQPATAVNMHQVYQVYKKLNSEVEPEVARFRPFEDHHYPGTRYNRFEYSRFWDRERMIWIYTKKRTAEQYNKEMARKGNILVICLFMLSAGTLLWSINYRMIFGLIGPQTKKEGEKSDKMERVNFLGDRIETMRALQSREN